MDKNNILIVDDDLEFCSLLEDVLSNIGYCIEKSLNGTDALKKLEDSKFDLVITDKNMPDIGGIELISAIKKKYPSTPVIMTTAFGDSISSVSALKHGAFEYITKPVRMSVLVESIQKALKNQKKEAQNR